jgi:hypothetical protein
VPEYIPVHATVHYKCAFDITSDKVDSLMTHLRKKLRTWCIEKVGANDQKLHRQWFYLGSNKDFGQSHYYFDDFQIRTAAAPGRNVDNPSCWAMELIHPDSELSARHWSVEVTLREQEDGSIRFTTVNKHWLMPFYIGEYPEFPAPSTPRYVRTLLGDRQIRCSRNQMPLKELPSTVTIANARRTFDLLRREDRQVPCVLISASTDSGIPLVDPSHLARVVAGNANVYFLESGGATDEMNYYLTDGFQCTPGMLRVYLPGLDLSDRGTARYQRFFTPAQINELGSMAVVRHVANGLSRNGKSLRLSDFSCVTDVFTERRRLAIRKLAKGKFDASNERDLVWDDNELLTRQLAESEQMAKEYSEDNERLKAELHKYRHLAAQSGALRLEVDAQKASKSAISNFRSLPKSVDEVLQQICLLYPDRLVATEEAIQSAIEISSKWGHHWSKLEQLSDVWEMLMSLAEDLYTLIFIDEVSGFPEAFNAQSPFEFAMTEGKNTKKNDRLMNLRKIHFEGEELDITPHLKSPGDPMKALRIHVAIQRSTKPSKSKTTNDELDQKKRLIIGHCGKHLENASSRGLK